jgi:hypothetical protein
LISKSDGGCDFIAADDGSLSPEQIVWTEQAFPRVLRVTKLVDPAAPTQFVEFSRLDSVHHEADSGREYARWPSPAGTHRFVIDRRDDAAEIDAIVLPLDAAFEIRLDAARRLWRALNGRPPGPAYGALPRQSKMRHILNLRAHDGRRAGATHRRIAETLLTNDPIASRDWRDHPLRHKVGAILRRTDRLVADGYRDLLYYPGKAAVR